MGNNSSKGRETGTSLQQAGTRPSETITQSTPDRTTSHERQGLTPRTKLRKAFDYTKNRFKGKETSRRTTDATTYDSTQPGPSVRQQTIPQDTPLAPPESVKADNALPAPPVKKFPPDNYAAKLDQLDQTTETHRFTTDDFRRVLASINTQEKMPSTDARRELRRNPSQPDLQKEATQRELEHDVWHRGMADRADPQPFVTDTGIEIKGTKGMQGTTVDDEIHWAREKGLAPEDRVSFGDPTYNCFSHALTNGAAGELREDHVEAVLQAHEYRVVATPEKTTESPRVGDLVTYRKTQDGPLEHLAYVSGLKPDGSPQLTSKAGRSYGIYRHSIDHKVTEDYGKHWTVLRTDRLEGRLLAQRPTSAELDRVLAQPGKIEEKLTMFMRFAANPFDRNAHATPADNTSDLSDL